ncbi:molybdopterin molybdenumtransferase MoeA [Aeromicrobium phragmitis]|uniref:Molybdopterin molybdenumtransferase n=1 Tax=Aeromicrobium phragmitis TaxID=2478914 RepID=A0A3L8PQQ8_9ACTN|nr:gephyrin-like molybdotransferase Glp [Aeromicrobium phragmitis]RLV56963.1 molybdopterin molybdenumtransferase MoeA [Aeromicrobium phragmitis]
MSTSIEEHRDAVAHLIHLADARRRERVEDVAVEALTNPRRLAEDVLSAHDLPPFDNAQMDGYAVAAHDLAGATPQRPVALPVASPIPAGADTGVHSPGTAAPIMTGAPVPKGADTVIPIEHVEPSRFDVPEVRFSTAPPPGQFVRPQGDDVSRGALLLPRGTWTTPAAIGSLTAARVRSVRVEGELRVAIVSSGDEIASGQLADGNGVALTAAVREVGASASRHVVRDDPREFASLLDELTSTSDLVLTTGGISAGAYEVVRQVLEPLPASWFDHVPLQPAGPQGRALRNGLPIVCFPGNPVSTLVSFELFVRPALARSCGVVNPDRPAGSGRLAAPLTSPAGKLQVRRGRVDDDGLVHLVGGAGSHLLSSYAAATHLVFVPADADRLAAGDTVAWWRIATH